MSLNDKHPRPGDPDKCRGDIPKHPRPVELERIDYTNKELVRSTLEKYETVIADQEIENAVVVCADGAVIWCFGTKDHVYPDADLGERLKGASATHNHPPSSGHEYSFGNEDISTFMEYDMAYLRGIDEKYVYELSRDSDVRDEQPSIFTAMSHPGEMTRHSKVIEEAKSRHIGYTRRKR